MTYFPNNGISETWGFIQMLRANGFLSSFVGLIGKHFDKYTNKHGGICCRNYGKHDVFPVRNPLTVNREIRKKPPIIRGEYLEATSNQFVEFLEG